MIELGKYFYEEGSDSERAFYWLQNAAGKGDVTGLHEFDCKDCLSEPQFIKIHFYSSSNYWGHVQNRRGRQGAIY